MNIKDILAKIGTTEAPLARQLMMTGLITRLLEDRGKPAPALIVGRRSRRRRPWSLNERIRLTPSLGDVTLVPFNRNRERTGRQRDG